MPDMEQSINPIATNNTGEWDNIGEGINLDVIEGQSILEQNPEIPKTSLEQADEIITKYSNPDVLERNTGNPDDLRFADNTVNLLEEVYDVLNNSEQPGTLHDELLKSEQKYDRIAKRYESRNDTGMMQHYYDLAKVAHNWAERTQSITSAEVSSETPTETPTEAPAETPTAATVEAPAETPAADNPLGNNAIS